MTTGKLNGYSAVIVSGKPSRQLMLNIATLTEWYAPRLLTRLL